MYIRTISTLLACCCVICAFANAQTQDSAASLRLLPAPKEVHLAKGEFVIKSTTQIILEPESKAAAQVTVESLKEEIENQGGPKIANEGAKSTNSPIVLGTLSDSHLRSELAAKGLKAESGFSPQGYLLYADDSRILVAGATPQGLFYGVQTLRQLLRPKGKELICPAVSIRDWPSMEWRGVHDDISRGPIPTLDYMKKQIRVLASYKVNLFALYMEHVFDFKSQPLIAPKEAALTGSDSRTGRVRCPVLCDDFAGATNVRASSPRTQVRNLF